MARVKGCLVTSISVLAIVVIRAGICVGYGALTPSENDRLFNGVYFTYEGKTSRESDLPQCPSATSVCSLVHLRFWLPVLSQRLCRCRNGQCPFQWDTSDGKTMLLNNRIQMKFCHPVTKLPECAGEPAPSAMMHQKGTASSALQLSRERPEVKINCTCRYPSVHVPIGTRRYLDGSSVTAYTCRTLKPCAKHESCGAIRTDTYSTYHTCGCPAGQLCLFSEVGRRKVKRDVDHLFYRAPAYVGQCRAIRR